MGAITFKHKGFISCQGESGSCAFGASRAHHYDNLPAPQPSFEDVIRRVAERDAMRGILPIQNSRSGLIQDPVMLIARSDLFVVSEHYQRIRHHLLVPRLWVESVTNAQALADLEKLSAEPDLLKRSPELAARYEQLVRALLSQITAVYADEQAFRQCDRGLKIYLSAAERRVTSCTAKAARVIAHESDMAKLAKKEIPAYAAIASEECAQMYRNLRLFPDLNDDPGNTTRYVVIEREEAKPSQILEDLDVKTILHELNGDIERVFEADELKDSFEEARKAFQLMQSDAESSQPGQLRNAMARILRAHLCECDRGALRRLVPGGKLLAKLERLHAQVQDHKLRGEERAGEARLRARLSDAKYQDRLRSMFIIRAGNPKTQLADLMKPFYRRKGRAFDLRIIAELPKTFALAGAAAEEMGIGIVAEANGSLHGAFERFRKKRGGRGLPSLAYAHCGGGTPLEAVLHEIQKSDPKAEIRILGTFAKDPKGFTAQEAAQIASESRSLLADWRPSRLTHGEGEGLMGSLATLVGTLILIGAGAAALYYFGSGF